MAQQRPRLAQSTSIRYSERLEQAGIARSVASVGDSFDNALAETINGLFKTELIKPRGPWRTQEHVEFATAQWVDWSNHSRLYEYCVDIPPAELEHAFYAHHSPAAGRADRLRQSPDTPGWFTCAAAHYLLRPCLLDRGTSGQFLFEDRIKLPSAFVWLAVRVLCLPSDSRATLHS